MEHGNQQKMGSTTKPARFLLGRVPLNHEYIRLGGFVLTMQSESLKVEVHVVLKMIDHCNQKISILGEDGPLQGTIIPSTILSPETMETVDKI